VGKKDTMTKKLITSLAETQFPKKGGGRKPMDINSKKQQQQQSEKRYSEIGAIMSKKGSK